jgi:stage II sporulation protein AA (anti-sigma F factor antagonist)
MVVKTKIKNNNLCIYLEGELDQSVATKLRSDIDNYLDRITVKNVVFDMEKLSFMDSTGIGLIMGRYKKLKAKNIPIYITKPNMQIDKVLRVSGIYKIIPQI